MDKQLRGFARMDPVRQKELARKGGAAVPKDKRSFSQNRELAAESGRKGGASVAPGKRSFSVNNALAMSAGRVGGKASQRNKKLTVQPEE